MSTPQATTADAPNTTFVTDSPTNQQVELHGSIWMTIGGANFGGTGRIGLLAQIAESGSISKAAKAIGMSYKAAWDAIDIMNNLAGQPSSARWAARAAGEPASPNVASNSSTISRLSRTNTVASSNSCALRLTALPTTTF